MSHFSIPSADVMKQLPTPFFATLVQQVNREIAAGHDVINLGQGNPDTPTPPHIVKALQESANNAQYHKYSPFRGYAFLKEAVAQRYRSDYGVMLDPETEVAIFVWRKNRFGAIAADPAQSWRCMPCA